MPPALAVGQPDQSLLVSAILHGKTRKLLPKSKLPQEEITNIMHWIKLQSPWANAEPFQITNSIHNTTEDSVSSTEEVLRKSRLRQNRNGIITKKQTGQTCAHRCQKNNAPLTVSTRQA